VTTEDLILLGMVENATGYYIGPVAASNMIAWPGPVVEVMPYKSISEALAYTDRPNAEGYVIRSHNFMVKLKQPDYLELHRLVTNASPKTVWEQLKQGKSKSEIVSAFPDEFHDYIGGMVDPLLETFNRRLDDILRVFAEIQGKMTKMGVYPEDRKQYAQEITKHKDARYFFLMLDGKPVSHVLWSELKPKETAIERMENA
jgi:RNA ligase